MSEKDSPKESGSSLLIARGLALLIVVVAAYGLYKVIGFASRRIFPSPSPASLSLAAYFDTQGVGEVPAFRIVGEAQQHGKWITEGKAKVTVETVKGDYRQSVLMDLDKDGFNASGVPAFRWITPCDRIHVITEVWSPQLPPGAIKEEFYLNAGVTARKRPTSYQFWLWPSLLVFGIFLIVFTGRTSKSKNRIAIILSYCVIFICMGFPFLAPIVLVRQYPDLLEAMKETPVGLVITRTDKDPAGSKINPQWALNIGGHVKVIQPACQMPVSLSPASVGSPPAAPTVGQGGSTATSTPGAAGSQGAERGSNLGGTTAIRRKGAKASGTKAVGGQVANTGSSGVGVTVGKVQENENTARGQGANAGAPVVGPASGPQQKSEAIGEDQDIVDVEGGLAIPLYIIILSVIGGVINMTRQVPKFQKQEQEEDGPGILAKFISFVGTGPGGPRSTGGHSSKQKGEKDDPQSTGEGGSHTEAHPSQPGATSGAGSAGASGQPTSPSRGGAGGQSDAQTEEEDWRTGLLHQYMYLVSAPFLAIATYYLLLWLDLNKIPVLVLVSISVGLISEPVLRTITEKAQGFLTGGSPKKEGPEHGGDVRETKRPNRAQDPQKQSGATKS